MIRMWDRLRRRFAPPAVEENGYAETEASRGKTEARGKLADTLDQVRESRKVLKEIRRIPTDVIGDQLSQAFRRT